VAGRLVELALPAELDRGGCTSPAPGDGELYQLSCPAAEQPEGFPTATNTAYDGDGAQAAVAAAFEEFDLAELDDEYSCGSSDDPEGWIRLEDFDGNPVGRLSCNVDTDALSSLRSWWSDAADLR
jgi:serine/threonine-protein kinase